MQLFWIFGDLILKNSTSFKLLPIVGLLCLQITGQQKEHVRVMSDENGLPEHTTGSSGVCSKSPSQRDHRHKGKILSYFQWRAASSRFQLFTILTASVSSVFGWPFPVKQLRFLCSSIKHWALVSLNDVSVLELESLPHCDWHCWRFRV